MSVTVLQCIHLYFFELATYSLRADSTVSAEERKGEECSL